MIEIEIDGKKIAVEQGTMIIEAADNNGINIPRFCYHKKLSIAANCRMCLVEVEKAAKPLPACATPVTPGMRVFTHSDKALESQQAVMEFLLINHPLDCPICDQGGECELQDISMGYGSDVSRFTEGKRVVADEDIGPLIETEMTRCIQCTRCVRFGQEIAGIRELGAVGRGEHMMIGTYVKHTLVSELSGNIIDLCPVGALTSKPFRFKARAWELRQTPSIARHDCLGSNIYVHSRNKTVMRVVPRENESINENWLSDRDRFSYLGLASTDRLQVPMIKQDSYWQEVDWLTALNAVTKKLKKVIEAHGPSQIAAIASPNSTLEEFYLLQKLVRALGSPHIDYRLRETDYSDQEYFSHYPALNGRLQDLESQNAILLIGSNIQKEIPLLSHRLRKAALQGGQVFDINPVAYEFNFSVKQRIIVHPYTLPHTLAAIVKLLAAQSDIKIPAEIQPLITAAVPNETTQAIANALQRNEKTAVLLGSLALHHPHAALLRALGRFIAKLTGSMLCCLTDGANSAGAWLAGAILPRGSADVANVEQGLNTHQAFARELKAYLLLDVEPDLDCAHPRQAAQALAATELVVALTAFKTPYLLQHADILLPIASLGENAGTYINLEGTWQSFDSVVPAAGESRPAWKIFRVLGDLLKLTEFGYNRIEEIRAEIKLLADNMSVNLQETWPSVTTLPQMRPQYLTRITEWPIYSIDNLVRRAEALQKSGTVDAVGIRVNVHTAQEWQLREGVTAVARQEAGEAHLPIIIDERIPDGCVLIPAGVEQTTQLGASFGEVEVRHV